jgi:hypothetical protein
LHNPQNCIFSLALNLGTYTPYLFSVVVYSKEREKMKERKNYKGQALACLMSIVLSFVLYYVIDC